MTRTTVISPARAAEIRQINEGRAAALKIMPRICEWAEKMPDQVTAVEAVSLLRHYAATTSNTTAPETRKSVQWVNDHLNENQRREFSKEWNAARKAR